MVTGSVISDLFNKTVPDEPHGGMDRDVQPCTFGDAVATVTPVHLILPRLIASPDEPAKYQGRAVLRESHVSPHWIAIAFAIPGNVRERS